MDRRGDSPTDFEASAPVDELQQQPATANTSGPIGEPAAEPLPNLGQEQVPICVEPWRNTYILRRGIMPCCYGSRHIAEMDEYRDSWNSNLMQSIRGELAARPSARLLPQVAGLPDRAQARVHR